MAVRPWHLVVLVWVPFLSVFVFAALGDTSALHITSHLLAIACLVPAVVLVLRLRGSVSTRAGRGVATVLAVVLPLAVLGHLAELGVAVARLASDGWVNRDTADIWVRGPHVWAANVTVPAMMLSMLGVLVLAAAVRRSRPQQEVA
ncbi:hypothetical protein [Phycicoccus avicenniae]|uniref:hypothetical protein n=1 Tax=Phycicoccus avicenniae TaxID=2828860 RepID=UPI003D280469